MKRTRQKFNQSTSSFDGPPAVIERSESSKDNKANLEAWAAFLLTEYKKQKAGKAEGKQSIIRTTINDDKDKYL